MAIDKRIQNPLSPEPQDFDKGTVPVDINGVEITDDVEILEVDVTRILD